MELLDSAIGDSGETFVNPTVDLSVAAIALSILIISGALAGLIPAAKAIAIKPVEALRAE
jgi:putative ABC transport system permease protein